MKRYDLYAPTLTEMNLGRHTPKFFPQAQCIGMDMAKIPGKSGSKKGITPVSMSNRRMETSVFVEFSCQFQLLDRVIDGSHRGFAMTAEIMTGLIQVPAGATQ